LASYLNLTSTTDSADEPEVYIALGENIASVITYLSKQVTMHGFQVKFYMFAQLLAPTTSLDDKIPNEVY
jgi:lipoate-protein ligase B